MSFDGKLAFQHSLAARQIVFNWNLFYLKKKTKQQITLNLLNWNNKRGYAILIMFLIVYGIWLKWKKLGEWFLYSCIGQILEFFVFLYALVGTLCSFFQNLMPNEGYKIRR